MISLKPTRTSIFLILLLFACSSDDDPGSLTNQIDAATFTLSTPDGWILIEDQGTDTYVGRIAGTQDTIYFDQGYLSFRSLDDVIQSDQTLMLKKLEINNVPSTIHKERRDGDPSGEIRLSVYIDDNQRKNRLYVFDPKNERLILQILMTHQFK